MAKEVSVEADRSDSLSDVDSELSAFVRGLGLPRHSDVDERPEQLPATLAEHLEVIRRVGAGGTGTVYLARDNRLRRDVAVKLVAVDSSGAARRVEREAQAMARLSHPNVLVVHEVGVYSEGIYIAMEYVDGGTLRRWLAESKRAWPEIVGVFVQAARGLHAAHLAGLSHCDFKPENVLVGREGRVRVADFGLARSRNEDREASDVTASPTELREATGPERTRPSDAVAGTPAYMAPERVLARADGPLADQFALGVSLYEALCGYRPYGGAMSWSATAGDLLPAPAKLPRWLRGVMVRSVALESEARFPDVGTFADALERGLARASRRRLAAAIAVLTSLTAAIGIGVGSMFAEPVTEDWSCGDEAVDRVWNGDRAGQIATAFARTGSPVHEQMHADVVARLDAWAGAWRAQRADACGATHERGEQSAELLDRRMLCLDQRLASIDVALELLAEADREVVMRATDLIADQPALDVCADAERMLSAVPPPDDPALAAEVEHARRQLARARADLDVGRYPGAVTNAKAVHEGDVAARYDPLRAEAAVLLGMSLARSEERGEAEAVLEQGFHDALAAGHDEIVAAAARELVCNVAHIGGGTDRAHRWAKTAEAAGKRLVERPSEQIRFQYCRAIMRDAAAEYSLAVAELSEAIAGIDGSVIDDSEEALLHDMLGAAYQGLHQLEQARREHELAYEMISAARGPTHPRARNARSNLGQVLTDLGETEAALAIQLDTLQAIIAMYGPESAATLNAYNNVALAFNATGARARAVEYLERGIEIARKHPDQQRTLMWLLGNLASYVRRDDLARSIALGREAVAIAESAYGSAHVKTAQGHVILASGLAKAGLPDEATTAYRRALEVFEAALGESSVEAGFVHLNLATDPHLSESQRDFDRNIELAERSAIATGDARLRAGVMGARAGALRDRGDVAAARPLQARAIELLAAVDPVRYREQLVQLGRDDLELGDPAAALTSFERARELATTAGDETRVAAIELDMARAAWRLGERRKARAFAENALATSRRLASEAGIAEARAWLAKYRG